MEQEDCRALTLTLSHYTGEGIPASPPPLAGEG